MLDVLIALIPALIWAIYQFGWRVLTVCALSMASAVLFEYLFNKLAHKKNTIGDCSALVTGLLFAFSLPASAGFAIVVLGTFFAIVVVKGLFGGLGKNIVNPALAARVFVFISFPAELTRYTDPGLRLGFFESLSADAVSSATPLAVLKNGTMPSESALNLLFGSLPGSLGEVSALLLLAGGLYLAIRRVIDIRIPLSVLATVAVFSYFLPVKGLDNVQFMLAELLSGGLMLGAIFMATDYVTSPATKLGRVIYGIGIGLITMFIRYFGGYPEGVSFAILIMNLFVYYLDRYTKAKPFGQKGAPKHAA